MSERPLRILVITVDWPPIEGGISTVAVGVSRELAKLEYHVAVLAPKLPGGDTFDRDENVRVVRVGGYHWGWFRFFPMLVAALRLAPHFDLILGINIAYGGLIGLIMRSLFGVPYGTFAYGYEFLKFKGFWPAKALLRYIYGQSRGVIAISRFTREKLVEFGLAKNKIAAILPGASPDPVVDPVALEAIRNRFPLEHKRLVLSVGRMIPRKGHLTLVRAWAQVVRRVPTAHLIIVGQGPSISECSRAAQRASVRDHITFAGRLSDAEVQALYHECEVFALPTGVGKRGQVEGFGLVFSEAHAHGKPVVAGKSGGVSEAVGDGETGLVVEPDDPDKVADAILQILTDFDFGQRLGDAGRRRVATELNWEVFTRRMLTAFGVTK